MWSSVWNTSRGGFSARRIITFVLATLVATISLALLVSTPLFAADWQNDQVITHDGNLYYGPASDTSVSQLGLAPGSQAYNFIEDETHTPRHVHVIYFEPSVDTSVATSAKYRTYIYQGPDSYINPSSDQEIPITPLTYGTPGSVSSCNVDHGIGWMICPITNFLASSMDWFFDILSGFLEVRPVETGSTETALYRAWSFMRTFANIAFVIGFLIIIYSQITSIGLSSYSIKSLLPRLIIAALLVNLSFFISALAIDLSNILGYSLQNLFIDMRNGLVGTEGNSWDLINWDSLGSFVLSGGTLVAAGAVGIFASITSYGVGGSLLFLLVGLVIALMSVLVALLIMAARQALITILVVISPLAFVAYLLPNTEKWFDKWRSLFMTMLILFPAFSIIFGGSQLAASIILQNADSINLLILGLLVQVAPLIITPMLVKLSGSLLGKLAGMVNNPNKGIIDRTRNFVKDRTDHIAAKRLGTTARPHQVFKRNTQRIDANKRRREGWKSAYTNMADARWANSREFSDIDQANRESTDRKTLGETRSELRYSNTRTHDQTIRHLDTNLRHAQLRLENSKLAANIQWENNDSLPILDSKLQSRELNDRLNFIKQRYEREYKELQGGVISDRLSRINHIIGRTANIREILTESTIDVNAISAANAHHQQEFARLLKKDSSIAVRAGGIVEHGAVKVTAAANMIIEKAMEEAIKNIQSTSGIKAGAIGEIRAALDSAVSNQDTASIVAYINKLAESSNPGIQELRSALRHYETSGALSGDTASEVKQYINANSTINSSAEDIGTWSRQEDRSLTTISNSPETWSEMNPVAWAGQKKSSQIESFKARGVNATMAKNILSNSSAAGNLKPSIRQALEEISQGKEPTILQDLHNTQEDD